MKRILLSVSVVLSALSVSSCDMLGDMIDKFNDVLENYEERLVLSDAEMNEQLRGKWVLNKVGRALTTNNKYSIEQVQEDPNLVSSIESVEIDGSTFKFNFKKSTKFERRFWIEDVGLMQTEEVWYESYTAEEGSATLYVGFDIDDVEVFTLLDYASSGFYYTDIMLFGEDILGNGWNLKVNRMVINSTVDNTCHTYYEFVPAK